MKILKMKKKLDFLISVLDEISAPNLTDFIVEKTFIKPAPMPVTK